MKFLKNKFFIIFIVLLLMLSIVLFIIERNNKNKYYYNVISMEEKIIYNLNTKVNQNNISSQAYLFSEDYEIKNVDITYKVNIIYYPDLKRIHFDISEGSYYKNNYKYGFRGTINCNVEQIDKTIFKNSAIDHKKDDIYEINKLTDDTYIKIIYTITKE